MAEDFGVEDRGHFYDPVGALRDVVVNHLMQVVAAVGDGDPFRPGDRSRSRTLRSRCSTRSHAADPAHYVRGQYDGYLDIDGVAPDSTTETYAALRLEIENWRWAGVPFFIRTGKRLAATADRASPRLQARAATSGSSSATAPRRSRTSSSSSSTHRPGSGSSSTRTGPIAPEPQPIELDMEFAEEGGEGPTPYEVLLHAAMIGDSTRVHPPGRRRRDSGGSCSRCSTTRRRSIRTRRAPGARAKPTPSSPAMARWHEPWVAS